MYNELFNIKVNHTNTLGKPIVYCVKRASANVKKSRVLYEKMTLQTFLKC